MPDWHRLGTACLVVTGLLAAGLAAPLVLKRPTSSADSLTVERITQRLYVLYGAGGNVVFLVTDEGVAVVDAGNGLGPGRNVAAKIREVSGKRITHLILSHYHGDHVLGAARFPPDVTIVSHLLTLESMDRIYVSNAVPGNLENPLNVVPLLEQRLRDLESYARGAGTSECERSAATVAELSELQQRITDLREFEIVLPTITFADRLSLQLDGESIDLFHLGAGHTDGDLVVFFPDEKSVYVGDLLATNGSVPRLDGDAGASSSQWPETLRRVGELPVEHVVPGHGKPIDRSALEAATTAWIGYLAELRDSVAGYIARGVSLEAVKQALTLPAYERLGLYHEVLPYNIDAVYRELTADAKVPR